MRRIRFMIVACLLITAIALTACNKNGELDLKSVIATGTPTPEESEKEDVTSTPEPTKEPTPTAVPTAAPTEAPTAEPTVEPTAEPTAEPTEEVTPTEVPVTEEPTPVVNDEGEYGDESIEYEIPELLTVGLAEVSDTSWNEADQSKAYDIAVDMLVLTDEEKEKYPYLGLKFDILNMTVTDMAQNGHDQFQELVDDGNILENGYYYLYENYDIVRADSYVVSLKDTYSLYSGGVRDETYVAGCAIDTQTGEVLDIQDICNDTESLSTILAYKLAEKYDIGEDDEIIDELIAYLEKKIEDNDIMFAVGYEGVTFYFPSYEMVAEINDNLSVTVPLDEAFVGETAEGPKMIGVFKKKYRTVADSYMQTMTFGEEAELLDIDEENSEFSTLAVCRIPSEYYPEDSNGLYFLINGEEKLRLDKMNFYGGGINLIKAGDCKYVMITTTQDSEDTYTYVFKLNENGEIGSTGDNDIDDYTDVMLTSLKYVYGEGEYDYTYTYKEVYDPMNTSVTFRHDVIGTNFVNASVCFNTADEEFELLSPFFEFSYKWPLTLKKEFKAGMIDPELMFNGDDSVTGEMDMEVELKAGDVIYLEKCRGTDRDQVFFSTDSGEWGTFMMDQAPFCSIDGEDANEIFNGIVYAD